MEKQVFGFTDSITLTIDHDDSPESPREWDNCSTWYFWSRDRLGDCRISRMNRQEFEEYLKDNGIEDVIEIFPLYLYDHSGQTVSITPFVCQFDSGQVGWIVVRQSKLNEVFGEATFDAKEKADSLVALEVDTFNQYLHGEVFEFRVMHKGKVIDSCSGFFGNEDAKSEGIHMAKLYADELDLAPRMHV